MDKRVKLHIHGLCRLSKGYYSIPEILEMEEDMLFAVDWKFTPTPIEFVKQYVELFPELLPTEVDVGMSDDELIAAAQEKVDKTLLDTYFAFTKPSIIGAGCLGTVLQPHDVLSHLVGEQDFSDASDVQKRLLEEGKSTRRPRSARSGDTRLRGTRQTYCP